MSAPLINGVFGSTGLMFFWASSIETTAAQAVVPLVVGIQAISGPDRIVVMAPLFTSDASFLEALEDLAVEQLVAKTLRRELDFQTGNRYRFTPRRCNLELSQ